jgi:polysaccharide deacetylase 2 family uncharacterized protein YibQ
MARKTPGNQRVYRSPLDPPEPKFLSRRVVLACAGTLTLGMVGGALLSRLGAAKASATLAHGPVGAGGLDSGRFHLVAHENLDQARRAFLDPRDIIIQQPMAEGAEPSILDTSSLAPTQVVRPPMVADTLPPVPPPKPVRFAGGNVAPDSGGAISGDATSVETAVTAPSSQGILFEPPRLAGLVPSEGIQLAPASLAAPASTPARVPGYTPPSVRPQVRSQAAWLDNGLRVPDPGGRPMVSVVIDDLGLNHELTQAMIGLPGPLTLSFMAYARSPGSMLSASRTYGHEPMLHMPMEPKDSRQDPGPGALLARQDAPEIRRRLLAALDHVPGVAGLNNHMGSRFTEDARGMGALMAEMAQRGLMFLDSRTTGQSVCGSLARVHGVPFVERAVFIDHQDDPGVIKGQLALAEQAASRHGHAVAIGHPRPNTYKALARWLPTLAGRGYALVPASAIIRYHA